MIDQNTIDRIMSAAKIEEVVGDYVSLKRRGVNLIGLCPFHSEKTPSFIVSPAKGICHCFGCGKGGNPVNFIMEIEQVNYYDALRALAKKYGIEIIEKELTDEQKAQRDEREAMFAINDFARGYFSNILLNDTEGRSVGLSYFRERGINDASIKTFQLGYSLKAKDALTKEALGKGFKKDFLVKTGLTLDNEFGVADRFCGRVIYPVQTISGKVVAFGGRVLVKNDKTAKYVNSPESDIYHKSDQLYGIYQAKQDIVRKDLCYLVEGYMDVISMHQSGIKNVVASSGTSLTTGQIRLIHRFTNNVTVLYDGDAAGIHASIRGIDMLLAEGLNIKVVSLPDGEDPDSYAQTHNADKTIEYMEQHAVDFIKFKTRLLLDEAGGDPIKRAQLIADIVKSISVIPDNITRSVYVRECSRMMEIEESTLFYEIDRIKRGQPSTIRVVPTNQKQTVAPQPVKNNDENPFFREESEIIKFVIRYGAVNIFSYGNGKWISVVKYIKTELDKDSIGFHNESFAELFKTAYEYCEEQNNCIALEDIFTKETLINEEQKEVFYEKAEVRLSKLSLFLFSNANPDVSRTATNQGIDKYQLSRTQKTQYGHNYKRLRDTLLTLIKAIRYKVILIKIDQLTAQIEAAQKNGDGDKMDELLKDYAKYSQVKKLLSEERVIIP